MQKFSKIVSGQRGGNSSMGDSVSLKDIAKACNVSVSTVSKAMNDRSDVSSAKKGRNPEDCQRNELCSQLYGFRTEESVHPKYWCDSFRGDGAGPDA